MKTAWHPTTKSDNNWTTWAKSCCPLYRNHSIYCPSYSQGDQFRYTIVLYTVFIALLTAGAINTGIQQYYTQYIYWPSFSQGDQCRYTVLYTVYIALPSARAISAGTQYYIRYTLPFLQPGRLVQVHSIIIYSIYCPSFSQGDQCRYTVLYTVYIALPSARAISAGTQQYYIQYILPFLTARAISAGTQ